MSKVSAIAVHDLSFAYDGPLVLRDVNLTVQEGEFVGIVGPNGGGKTTLLKLILGLLEPTGGEVRVFGERPQKARRRCGYVPQVFHYDRQFPVTVEDVVLMGRLGCGPGLGPYSRADRRAAEEALAQVGLADLGGRSFADLSGGERQRTLVARALTTHPDLLMLDEPTANVDAAAEGELYRLLGELNRTMTIVVVTHDLAFVSGSLKSVICVSCNVVRHATVDIRDVTSVLLEGLYGGEVKMVRHDQTYPEERE